MKMNEKALHVISAALAAITIGGMFCANFLGAMYASDYLLPDRPGVALLSGLVAGIGAVAWMGRIARRYNEQHEHHGI